jgi:hypothetical protein
MVLEFSHSISLTFFRTISDPVNGRRETIGLPAFCAKQLGHSVEMFLRTYAKWIDGGQNALEMGRLEAAIAPSASTSAPKKGR